ncbi:MAG: histidine--tRNA ligase [Phycisphaerae bacterium]
MRFQAPKGTRDFYPEDMAARNWIMDTWRRVSLRNGFEEYDGPIFELLDLYKAKSGEGIVSELFHFEDRGGRELAIRPEMTPTLARMIAARANSLPRPIKWFSMPRLCRAERPQRGRLREFFQWNIDLVGVDDVVSDAECILVAIDFFREIGLTPDDVVMKINSRSLLSSLLVAQGFEKQRHEDVFAVLDKRDKLPLEAFVEAVEKVTRNSNEKAALLDIGQAAGDEGLAGLEEVALENEAAEAELARLKQLLGLLAKMGVGGYCQFDMGVVRGLAYYTGVVFEAFGKGEFQRAICGGGRYGFLLEAVGGPSMSGIGFGTSDVVILTLLAELNRLPAEARKAKQVDFFLIDADPNLFDEVLALAARLRKAGFAAEFSYRRQGLGKQLKQASSCNATRAVIIGSEYAERQVLSVKDLASGQQIEVGIERFLADPLGQGSSNGE